MRRPVIKNKEMSVSVPPLPGRPAPPWGLWVGGAYSCPVTAIIHATVTFRQDMMSV